jgi:hypothetical protein
MTAQFSSPFSTRHLRRSLKRGLARQAIAVAGQRQADHKAAFAEFRRIAPNRKALERCVQRLRLASGTVSAGISDGRLILVLRNLCNVQTRSDGVEAFREDALIYTRIVVLLGRGGMATWINRASFSLHALERFVERSDCVIGPDLLPIIDTEAVALLRRAMAGDLIEQDDDSFIRARAEGVWAGSLDEASPDQSWAVSRDDACVPTFSARTFLGPSEMRPAVWLRWQTDPLLTLAV